MTETYSLLKSIIDPDKELYYSILDHHLQHVAPITSGDKESQMRNETSNVNLLKLKIESSDYDFSLDELSAFNSILGFHLNELLGKSVYPLSDEQMDERFDFLKPLSREIEDLCWKLNDN